MFLYTQYFLWAQLCSLFCAPIISMDSMVFCYGHTNSVNGHTNSWQITSVVEPYVVAMTSIANYSSTVQYITGQVCFSSVHSVFHLLYAVRIYALQLSIWSLLYLTIFWNDNKVSIACKVCWLICDMSDVGCLWSCTSVWMRIWAMENEIVERLKTVEM